jgi:hypothetical protein
MWWFEGRENRTKSNSTSPVSWTKSSNIFTEMNVLLRFDKLFQSVKTKKYQQSEVPNVTWAKKMGSIQCQNLQQQRLTITTTTKKNNHFSSGFFKRKKLLFFCIFFSLPFLVYYSFFWWFTIIALRILMLTHSS